MLCQKHFHEVLELESRKGKEGIGLTLFEAGSFFDDKSQIPLFTTFNGKTGGSLLNPRSSTFIIPSGATTALCIHSVCSLAVVSQ